MQEIEHTHQFRRDYKREAKGTHKETLASAFSDIVRALACDKPWPKSIVTTH